jgi:hypothetical protein
MMRKLIVLLVALTVGALGAYIGAGFLPGPTITVAAPERFIGVSTPVDIVVDTPGGRLSSMTARTRPS